jgi:hypothetical protein
MTATAGPIVYRLGPALLAGAMALAAWNWYLVPGRAASWAVALAVLAAMAVIFAIASRLAATAPGDENARRRAADTIRTAIVLATMLLAFSLGARLAMTLGVVEQPDLAKRGTMVFIGLFLVITGNALPKTLTPLSQLQCDGACIQAFQRFSGRAWVLTGLGWIACWLLLPLDVARTAAMAVVGGGMLTVVAQGVRLHRTRRREA